MEDEKPKPMTISVTPSQKARAKKLAIKMLGKPSVSGLLTFLLVKELEKEALNN